MDQGPPKQIKNKTEDISAEEEFLEEPEGLFEEPMESKIERALISISNEEPLDRETVDETKKEIKVQARKKVSALWEVLDKYSDKQTRKTLFLQGLGEIWGILDATVAVFQDSEDRRFYRKILKNTRLLERFLKDLRKTETLEELERYDFHTLMDKLETMFPGANQ